MIWRLMARIAHRPPHTASLLSLVALAGGGIRLIRLNGVN